MKMRYPITFKVSEEEKKIIEDSAKSFSLPTATYCRCFLLKQIQENQKENQE